MRGIVDPDNVLNGAATGASAGEPIWSSSANGSNGSSKVATLGLTATGTFLAAGAAEKEPISPPKPSSYGRA